MLDDPLWVRPMYLLRKAHEVLIPLLLDDPLWEIKNVLKEIEKQVLIPLLLDDPLWACWIRTKNTDSYSLNPSFAG